MRMPRSNSSMAIRGWFIREDNEHGICVAVRLPIPPDRMIRKGRAPVTPRKEGEAYAKTDG